MSIIKYYVPQSVVRSSFPLMLFGYIEDDICLICQWKPIVSQIEPPPDLLTDMKLCGVFTNDLDALLKKSEELVNMELFILSRDESSGKLHAIRGSIVVIFDERFIEYADYDLTSSGIIPQSGCILYVVRKHRPMLFQRYLQDTPKHLQPSVQHVDIPERSRFSRILYQAQPNTFVFAKSRHVAIQATFSTGAHNRYDLMCNVLFDIILGVCLMTMFMRNSDWIYSCSKMLLSIADMLGDYLQQLLQWMMGSPGGLKLNRQLTELMGTFFRYHVFLWTGYLDLIAPVIPWLLHGVCLLGCVGISFQLALILDLVALVTLHIHCIYIYATKLYSLHVSYMGSLWRLFRGRKWNPVKNRSEIWGYSTPELLLGTLVLTILVFLLPTTALYYFVFAVLESFVLLVVGVIKFTQRCVLSFPAYRVMLLCLFRSGKVASSGFFQPYDTSDADCLLVHMGLTWPSIFTVLSETVLKPISVENAPSASWGELQVRFFKGEQLDPWNWKK